MRQVRGMHFEPDDGKFPMSGDTFYYVAFLSNMGACVYSTKFENTPYCFHYFRCGNMFETEHEAAVVAGKINALFGEMTNE